MSFQAFKDKFIGQRIDTDGVPKGEIYQCVDLVKEYLIEEFGIPQGAYGNAIDYMNKPAAVILTKFDQLKGERNAQEGDIVVFNGTAGNAYGHIGIATGSINSGAVAVLEQNGSTGNGQGQGGDTVRVRYITQARIAGILRPKQVAAPAPAPAPQPAPEQPAPAPAAPGFNLGDNVVPTNLVSYDGVLLHAWDASYTITELRGDRAVLSARGSVWAAVNTSNLRKA